MLEMSIPCIHSDPQGLPSRLRGLHGVLGLVLEPLTGCSGQSRPAQWCTNLEKPGRSELRMMERFQMARHPPLGDLVALCENE